MKKILLALVIVAIAAMPHSAFAALNVLNGFSASQQFLVTPSGANTMHMEILDINNDTHRFRWDGTPWRIDQGGTGLLALPGISGSLFFNDVGAFGGDAGLTFDKITKTLTMGVSLVDGNTAGKIVTPDGVVDNGTDLYLKAGSGNAGGGAGGTIYITGGDALSGDSDGGQVIITPGVKSGTGYDGSIYMQSQDTNTFINVHNGVIRMVTNNTGAAFLNTDNISSFEGPKTFSFPNQSGTFGLLESTQTWSGLNTFSAGPSATTTVTFGKPDDTTSHACFNTKNTDGADISFYFSGTAMVVEANPCQ